MNLLIPLNSHGTKQERPKRCEQSILPKTPKTYNGSKSIPGNHKVVFSKASEV